MNLNKEVQDNKLVNLKGIASNHKWCNAVKAVDYDSANDKFVFGNQGHDIYECSIKQMRVEGENKKVKITVDRNVTVVTKGHYFMLNKEKDSKDDGNFLMPPVQTS